MPEPNYYSDGALDRAAERRGDAEWLAERLADPESRFYPVWRGKCAITEDEPPRPIVVARPGEGYVEAPILLGLRDGIAQFCVEIAEPEAVTLDEAAFHDLRDVALSMAREESALLAYGRGLVHWHQGHRHCGRCGRPTVMESAGHRRRCSDEACRRMNFPRTDPAVITLVTDGPRCLLARRGVWAENRRSTIAGFVEPGETLEDAVRRETLEEVGIAVGEAVYHSSQPWPFPQSLMLGFTAEAVSTEIEVDGDEIVAAAWYTPRDIETQVASGELFLPPVDSISRRLVTDWLDRQE
ncbi:MAG: NAD(+) diphosphatase [Alphaproteobacteria bacterium]|nr:NAD(+) diphosphatase [Alphaproteobacteria bacterium]